MGAPSIKLPLISWLFIIPFNFGFVHFIKSGLNKCIYVYMCICMYILKIVRIIWLSPSWFMKCMGANVWHWGKFTLSFFFLSMIIFPIANRLIITYTWRKRGNYYSVLVQECFLWRETSTYWKFENKIFKLV